MGPGGGAGAAPPRGPLTRTAVPEAAFPGGTLVVAGIAWVGGIALQMQQPALWPATHYATLLGLALGLAAIARRRRRALLALAVALAAFAQAGWRADLRLSQRLDPALEGVDLQVTGVVATLPHAAPQGLRFRFEVERAERGGEPVSLPRRLALGWYRGWHDDPAAGPALPALQAGQRWRFTVRLKRPHTSLNPGGFDGELWLFEQDVRATGTVRATAGPAPQRLGDSGSVPVERLRQRLRDAIAATVPDARAAGVLAALAVGDQGAIDREDWDVYRAAGVAHLMSISGLHVTMIAWLAGGLAASLWRRHRRAALACPAPLAGRWIGVAAATGYAVLAGWGVPAQRTVCMLLVAAALRGGSVHWPWPLVLGAAAVAVTLFDPWAVLQPGFWLSFGAVALLMASSPVRPHAGSAADGGAARAVTWLRGALRTQAIATVGLAPLTLVCFGQLSLVGFAANLVAIPLVTLAITPLALAGVAWPPLWSLAALGVRALDAVLSAMVSIPGAVWTVATAPGWAQAAGLAAGAVLLLPLPWRLRLLALPLALPLLAPAPPRPAPGRFELVAADVGQGTAVLVRTRGHLLLYDAGPQYSPDSDAAQRVLLPLLRQRGERTLDLLVLSHRDTDHTGGAAALLRHLRVHRVTSSLERGHPLRAAGVPHQPCHASQAWTWDGVRFELLHPGADLLEEAGRRRTKPNTLSCVLRIEDAAGRRALLTGDLEAAQEAALRARDAAALRARLLLVPHHGSATSSTPAFLDAVAPEVAVVQAGYRNRFGHPAPAVLARYEDRGIAVVRSDRCGAWHWDGERGVCERDRARRYWHEALPAR